MAIKIQGTDVINDSRELSNITNIKTVNSESILGAGDISIPTATKGSLGLDTNDDVRFDSLGIGTTASGTSGEIRATNNVTAFFSDERLKTRLDIISDALDKVCSLDTFVFEPNDTAQALGYEKTRDVGVSAQQVQKVLPEVVVAAPINDKYLTVRYEKMIPLLVEAIKDLKKEIDSLKDTKND